MKTGLLISFLLLCLNAKSQVIINGNFENSTTGWTSCLYIHGAEYLYGGSNPFNNVMLINGGASPRTTADDIRLCQTISNFDIGRVYTIVFDAASISNCSRSTNPLILNVTMSQGALNQQVEVLQGSGFQTFIFNFVATQNNHEFKITPNFSSSCGVMVDNVDFLIVVPIELVSFDAKLNGRVAKITWETAQEMNNDYFVVERTDNGFDWIDIRRIEAIGNSKTTQFYEVEDANFYRGTSYYRLKQFDKTGEVFYSETRAITWDYDFENTVLFPNPVDNQLFVQIKDAKLLEMAVFNAIGEQISVPYKQQTDNIIINTNKLEDGLYVLQLTRGTHSSVKQFVVQH